MIGWIDTLTLVGAKLRTKRALLFSITLITGILFAVLYGSVAIFDGVTKSAHSYTQKALDGRYLVRSIPILAPGIFGPSIIDVPDTIITELKSLQADYIAKQKSLAKDLKIPFDEKTIPAILVPDPYTTNVAGGQKLMINIESPVFSLYIQKLQQDYAKIAKNKLSDLQAAAKPYGASTFYQNKQATVSFQTMQYLADGKEDIAALNKPGANNSDPSAYGFTTSSVRNSQYTFVDQSLINRYILPENEKRKHNTAAIPVIITAKEAVDLFGKQFAISEKPDKAVDQIAWMKTLQEKMNGLTYTACYRNQADKTRVTKAAQALTEIEQHKDDKTYTAPSLIYNLPKTTCGDLSIKQDTRSASEKAETTKQDDISKKLGTYEQPVRQLFTFQIVGVMPTTPPQSTLTNLPSFLSDLLSAKYDAGAIIPKQLYERLPAEVQLTTLLQRSSDTVRSSESLEGAGIGETIIAFNNPADARAFINEQGCPTQDSCGKPFMLETYGSNYLLLDDLQATFTKLLSYALVGGMGIATLVIWFMMTRIIIDSRRETAVFRAIGAKRWDIASIYLLYSMAVALRIIACALILGLGAALVVQLLYSPEATNYAQASYGIFDTMEPFSLISLTSPFLAWITLGIIGISIIAVTPPLIRNVRRNPIADMRDE